MVRPLSPDQFDGRDVGAGFALFFSRQSEFDPGRRRQAVHRQRYGALVLLPAMIFFSGVVGLAQVSPAEVLNPQLKTAEQTYFPQLEALNRAITSTQFPFAFQLSRFVGLDPKQQVETDTRGVEFVRFHDRVVLKVTGNYNAAYSADVLTDNERASRTFQDVMVPMLRLVIKTIPVGVNCDAVGFEISYHVRSRTTSFDYEGKEILVVVLDKPDAFSFFDSASNSQRQDILNRSEIYLNGKDYGLQLGERQAAPVEALGRPTSHPSAPVATSSPVVPAGVPSPVAPTVAVAPPTASGTDVRLPALHRDLPVGFHLPEASSTAAARLTARADSGPDPRPDSGPANGNANPESTQPVSGPIRPALAPTQPASAPTQEDADRLQAEYQSQLDTLAKGGASQFHFVDYAPPSFAIFHNQIVLQISLRNTLGFENDSSSIYRRAARTFDLFLAPQLKGIMEKFPSGGFDAVDISVINNLGSKPKPVSEAIEFISPLKLLRLFADAEITNQDLINQSVVLVNGVRIALNLAQVE